MDSTGWRARYRAQEESARWSRPQRGPDGRYQPVEQIYPMSDPFVGGFGLPPTSPAGSSIGAPTPPPKDDYQGHGWPPNGDGRSHPPPPPAWNQVPHDDPNAPNPEPYMQEITHQLSHMSAVERSKNLRVVRMNPILQFMAGPLLRYDTVDEHGVWHGAAMIVTADAGSIYDPHPTLTYSWDPNHPSQSVKSTPRQAAKSFDLAPHPADPLSYANPVAYDFPSEPGPHALSQSVPGQEIWVYVGNGGTFTFWRFMIHIPLGPNEMAVSYSINGGQALQFHVPAHTQNMRWAAYSCNGFSAGINPDDFRGPGFQSGYDPVWVDLLSKHAERPFHVLVGGGDQLYCDGIVREPEMQEWVRHKIPSHKKKFPVSPEMRFAIDRFYFNHYCQVFRSGAFARANSTIPMLNMLDDHDLIDGFGSYPDDLMSSPVFSTIGSRGYFFFLLFQCFINVEVDGRDSARHPFRSVVIGGDGPWIPFPSHSFLSWLGPDVQILLLDCRAERKKSQVCSTEEYKIVFERLNRIGPEVNHLIVQLGIPIAYPRMVFLETALESKLNPLVALGRGGSMGLAGFVNKFNADAELLDDLNDHWTAKSHKKERNWFIEQLQYFAKAKHTRVAFLSGDVHCAAVGVLKTLVKGKNAQDVPPAEDYRYMLNVVTSAIVNTPPPNGVLTMVGTLATKTHRTLHHMDTDETMAPLFTNDPNGGAAKSKYIMGRRNWCCVDWEDGGLRFDIRVEKEKGHGETCGYPIISPPPRWN